MAEPKHGTSPIVVDETPGKKAYCQCGLSANLPYCDGSHSREGTGLAPIVCDTINRSPIFVSETLDNTLFQIDLNNEGVFDMVDADVDDCPDD